MAPWRHPNQLIHITGNRLADKALRPDSMTDHITLCCRFAPVAAEVSRMS
jgi:hypothetical protein